MSAVFVLLLGFAGLSAASYAIGMFLCAAPPRNAFLALCLMLFGGLIFFTAVELDNQVHVPVAQAVQPINKGATHD